MKTGFNMLLWTTNVTEDDFVLFEKLKAAGFDGVEIPVFAGEVSDFEKVGEALKDNGLGCTTVTVIPDEEHNPISADSNHRKGGLEHLKRAIDCSEALGAEVLCGPFYQPLGVFTGEGATGEEIERGVGVHRQAADYAAAANVVLGLEALNRFECYFMNLTDDAAAYARKVGRENFGLLFDTFHANIEERDPVGCIGRNIEQIKHVHISENDRGIPGRRHIDWAGTFKALRSGGYDGWLTVEAFGRALPDLAAATRVWRDFFSSAEEVYTESARFLQEQWAAG